MALQPATASSDTQSSLVPPAKVDAYIVLKRTDTLFSAYMSGNVESAMERVRPPIMDILRAVDPGRSVPPFEVMALPSKPMLTVAEGRSEDVVNAVRSLVVRIRIETADLPFFYAAPARSSDVAGFGLEAPIGAADHWCHGSAGGDAFSTAAAAYAFVGTDALVHCKKALTGKDVNVVLIDSGLDAAERNLLSLTPAQTGVTVQSLQHQLYAGLSPAVPRLGHAFGTARHLRAIAPEAKMHDYAILPPSASRAVIPSVQVRISALLSDMVAAYTVLEAQVAKHPGQSWVIVNSWAIYRRAWPMGQDVDNPSAILNTLIQTIADQGADIVFAAGNCGQFSSDPRCGRDDIGPGRSIIGPNGHPAVITTGAVRVDGKWVGASSQGPGMTVGATVTSKPDISAPSFFYDLDEPARIYSGTSTACAIVAGSIAALRQQWPNANIKQVMVQTANKAQQVGQDDRLGHGVLDLKALVAVL